MNWKNKAYYQIGRILKLKAGVEEVIAENEALMEEEKKTYNKIQKANKPYYDVALSAIYDIIDNMDYDTVSKQLKKLFKKKGLKDLIKIVNNIDRHAPATVKEAIRKINKIIAAMARETSTESANVVFKDSSTYYAEIKAYEAGKFGFDVVFGVPDEVAIARVNKYQNLFFLNHYKDDVTKQASNLITKTIIENEGVLNSRELAKVLKSNMTTIVRQKNYWQLVSSNILNRARSFSRMQFYSESRIFSYTVVAVLDNKTTEQCRFMDGTTLEVSKTLKHYEKFDEAESPEDMKNIDTWLTTKKNKLDGSTEIFRGKKSLGKISQDGLRFDNLTGEELQAEGVNAPPYHGNCRTTVIPVI